MNKLLLSKRRGFAIPLAVIAVVILLAMGMGLLSLGLNSRIYSLRNTQQVQARCAADAGLVKAVYELNKKLKTSPTELGDAIKQAIPPDTPFAPDSKPSPPDSPPSPPDSPPSPPDNPPSPPDSIPSFPGAINEVLPYCDASFSYRITAASVFAAMSGQDLTIECIGTYGGATAKVSALVGLQGLFDSAILVKDRISLMPNTKVAAYNSADPKDTDFDLKIGTTSIVSDRIPLGPGTVVDGDVFVGVGGDPESVIGAGGTITGNKYPLSKEPDFPVITPPSLTDMGTPLSAKGETITLSIDDSGTYTGIDLSSSGGNPGVLEIKGGKVVLHITGNIDMGNSCEVIVNPGSSLVIYIDGNVSANNSVGFNNQAGNVRDFQLYTTGTGEQVFDLKAKSSIFGTVYAPNVNITLYPSAEMHGAIIGKSVTFKSGCTFYYDESLRDNLSVYDEAVSFVIKRWREE